MALWKSQGGYKRVRAANGTVARLGGDEFVALLFPVQAMGDCEGVVERILATLSEPVALTGGATGRVAASVGFAL